MCKVVLKNVKKKINNQDYTTLQSSGVFDPLQAARDQWQNFMLAMRSCDDLVLVTMFQEAQFINFDQKKFFVTVSFLKKFTMFQDVLEKEKQRWLVALQNIYGHQVELQYDFTLVAEQKKRLEVQEHGIKNRSVVQISNRIESNKIDFSDPTVWKLTHELMKHFDGVITEMSGDRYD